MAGVQVNVTELVETAQLNPWSVPQWKFFIEDACRNLVPGGRLVLDLNEDVARFGARRWYDAAVCSYFNSVGSVIRNRVVVTA
ncbi:MAG: hypothetical protein ABJE66_26830 [Deltaproteobacteria bacterium]